MSIKLKINIASTNRFHLADLCRELAAQGHDVRFYSIVPRARLLRFGIDYANISPLLLCLLPLVVLEKALRGNRWITKLKLLVSDWLVGHFMRPCDVFIALGTVYERSLYRARKFKGARLTILEWGSMHVDRRNEILAECGDEGANEPYFDQRSRRGYQLADFIAVASDHVRESFIVSGVPEVKLIQNPYGVDLKDFYPEPSAVEPEFDLIMVGGWSKRKGCDLLIELCRVRSWRLLHVGALVDLPFPSVSNMVHIDPVDQSRLRAYYNKAKVAVLPSREEGLAMVQTQALACGLSLVCSRHSGGRDLRVFIDDPDRVIEIQALTVEALASAVELAVAKVAEGKVFDGGGKCFDAQGLSWTAYGDRYHRNLLQLLCQRTVG